MSIIQKLFGRPQETGSLHGEMHRLDVIEEVLADAVRAYQGLIDLLVVHMPKAAREIGQDQKKRLKQIRNLLDSTPSKSLIGEVRVQLDSTITKFASELDHQLGLQEKEAKQVMAIMAVMAESMADREKQYNVRFRGIGKKLRVLTTSNDLAEIRRKLEAEVAQLEKYVEEMARDTDSAVSRVQMELRQAKKPEHAASTALAVVEDARSVSAAKPSQHDKSPSNKADSAPLGGRRDAEQAIDARRRHDLRFCVARFSVDNVPAIAAQFGLPAAVGLVDHVGELIRERFEALDLVCRWSEQDLVVITDLNLPEAAMRVDEMEKPLAGPYSAGSREVTLALRTCVIERLRGELTNETIERIDTMIGPVAASLADSRRPAPARK